MARGPQFEQPDPFPATFEVAQLGMQLRLGEMLFSVSAKDETRIEVELESDFGKHASYYPSEFDARGFEVLPAPVRVPVWAPKTTP